MDLTVGSCPNPRRLPPGDWAACPARSAQSVEASWTPARVQARHREVQTSTFRTTIQVNPSDDRDEYLRAFVQHCSLEDLQTILAHVRSMHPDLWQTLSRAPSHPLEQDWNVSADVILDAIARSPDITQRGVRGILAEAVFERAVLPLLSGWHALPAPSEATYDFLIQSVTEPPRAVRIQVKLQRRERGVPKRANATDRRRLSHAPEELFIVEVQKTRTGKANGEDTRPYRFADFDILAVNMHPSCGDWREFRYTPATWLLPRTEPSKENLVKIMQPVAAVPDQFWTSSLEECLEWMQSDRRRTLYT